jgi:hypothetical protein
MTVRREKATVRRIAHKEKKSSTGKNNFLAAPLHTKK